jgi:hypothetical protein
MQQPDSKTVPQIILKTCQFDRKSVKSKTMEPDDHATYVSVDANWWHHIVAAHLHAKFKDFDYEPSDFVSNPVKMNIDKIMEVCQVFIEKPTEQELALIEDNFANTISMIRDWETQTNSGTRLDISDEGIQWDSHWLSLSEETKAILVKFNKNGLFEKWFLDQAKSELALFEIGEDEDDDSKTERNLVPYFLSLPFPSFAYNSDYGVAKYVVRKRDVDYIKALIESAKKTENVPLDEEIQKYSSMHVCDPAFCFSASYE